MRAEQTPRGFVCVVHPLNIQPDNAKEIQETRLVQESSAIGDYEDSFSKPGSSYLWFGEDHHLNREEVKELVDKLNHWLEHKRLPLDK